MSDDPAKRSQDTDSANSSESISSTSRSAISLLLFFHLFIMALVLSGNYGTSRVQARLLSFFSPYTRSLNLDLNYTPFHLTHATLDDVDHRLEVLPTTDDMDLEAVEDEDWISLPSVGGRLSERYKRYQRLAAIMAFFASRDDNDTTGLLARGVGANFLHQRDVTPRQVRVRKHLLQSMDVIEGGTAEQRDPNSATYFNEVYRANTLVLDDGTVEIIKVESAGQVAKPASGSP